MSDEQPEVPAPAERADPATIPALIITQADLQELDALMGELPMKYGLGLLQFINQRRLRQQQAAPSP